jgi:hypothetical protein
MRRRGLLTGQVSEHFENAFVLSVGFRRGPIVTLKVLVYSLDCGESALKENPTFPDSNLLRPKIGRAKQSWLGA